jgi:2-polyprenyl-3-methyl-5-hydroxy-6-metoxy-1,4-benzoquinol methylase
MAVFSNGLLQLREPKYRSLQRARLRKGWLSVEAVVNRFYYSRPAWIDGTSQFANLIKSHLLPEYRILDLGAGCGKKGPVNFRGNVRAVVGIDCDSCIGDNPWIDHSVRGLAQYLPFRSASFEMVISDWAVEHFAQPRAIASEVFRVLKPSGLFAFRTGNLRHYSYAIAAATPHWFHQLVANRARALPPDQASPHPTYYFMNTREAVRECLGHIGFAEQELIMLEPEPSYLMFSVPAFLMGVTYERLVNRVRGLSGFRACIIGCFRKP